MKKKLVIFFSAVFLLLILIFPEVALEGSQTGLLLWFHTVLPTLLPFIILTNLLLKMNAITYLTKYIYPLFHRLFSSSHYGCYSILCGFLCGYPMGAKTIAESLKAHKITCQEGQYLLGFCNNISPAFFISYVVTQTLGQVQSVPLLLLLFYAAPILHAIITKPGGSSLPLQKAKAAPTPLTFQIVDDSIMDGFETITRLGGYLILFAIIAKMATVLLHTVTIFETLIIGIIELTNGMLCLQGSSLSLPIQLLLAIGLCTFGGLSGIAQTKSMIQGSTLSIRIYLFDKLKICLLSIIFTLLYCLFFRL